MNTSYLETRMYIDQQRHMQQIDKDVELAWMQNEKPAYQARIDNTLSNLTSSVSRLAKRLARIR